MHILRIVVCTAALSIGPSPLGPNAFSVAAFAQAAGSLDFTPAAFDAAKAKGPVLVEVTAPWCPTCKAQKPILAKLLADPRFSGMTVLTVDFDSQKDVLETLGVTMQSTLICYKGGKEVARSTGQTNETAIATQLDKTL